ncbi:HAD family hydrolase [Martelella endophytica]|uniref:Hydrolase n=1 Tax=Martelella endophytica TaxID=1486262 RepID=A0A0D5LM23_MAREN|nr:HAD family hydrolase [Martelella endophytica]AJY45259.1 hydrolase [Martelella endophytica]
MPAEPLIIFDCDGVLVDSEPISLGVLREALAAEGVTICAETANRLFLGRSLSTMLSVVERDFGATLSADFLETLRLRLYARFRQDLQSTEGIADAWAGLKMAGIDWCVASSSQPERIRLSLELVGLMPAFAPPVFSATMVENGKPAPDLFLLAAERMGRPPADCIVIEDSPAGICAAKAAGMRVFAFLGGSHARNPAYHEAIAAMEPDQMFDAMDILVKLVRK